MESGFYQGSVAHRRSAEIDHEFSVNLFMVCLDITKLPELLDPIPGWSARNPALAWYRRNDHFGQPQQDLAVSVRDRVQKVMGKRPEGSIYLLTHLRYLGYLFNPVSFYYCFDKQDNFQAFIAEVHNTPWHEEHVYCVPVSNFDGSNSKFTITLDKDFHVSPFQPMDQHYRITYEEPDEELFVRIESYRNQNREFDACLKMSRKPLSVFNAYRMLLRYPFMSFKVTASIYFEALKLWWSGATFYPHPERV